MRFRILVVLLTMINLVYAKDNLGSMQNRQIEVTGKGIASSTPNRFSFSVHIEQKGESASELNQIINTKTVKIVNTLSTLGVKKTSIQALFVQFNPWYEYNGETNVQKGFSLSRKINVTLDDIMQYDKAIDLLLKLDINRIDGFNYSDSKDGQNYKKALSDALLNAKAQAGDMARTLGLKLGKVISISEQSSGSAAPVRNRQLMMAESASVSLPGKMSTQAEVKVIFSLVD